jgi:hypothetical protein
MSCRLSEKRRRKMTKHLIQGYFATGDRRNRASAEPGEAATSFDLVAYDKVLDHGIGGALTELKAMNVFPSEIALDLVILAAHVYAADTRISRSTESQDDWTRELRLVVPVSDVGRWDNAKPILHRMLNFLTGDRWMIEFRPRPSKFNQIVPQANLIVPPFTSANLFSGGLDSLIGAIDQMEAGAIPLLVSHAGEPAVSKSQDDCFDLLAQHYSKVPFKRLRTWMQFPKDLVRNVGSEETTRGRSFLFFALGIFAGSGLRRDFVLYSPENGLIALNVPLDALRLGALSTRTTHPFYIARWNELLKVIGIAGRIENPYWNKTKGEMVASCRNPALLKSIIPHSLSCASPTKGRWQGHGTQHCGYCLPCLIRRASLNAVGDSTTYTVPDLRAQIWDPRTAKGEQIRSFQYAAEKLRAKPGIEKLLIHKPGPLSDKPADIPELAAVYKRGLEEVGTLLKGVRTRPS